MSESQSLWQFWIDVGGTFTDCLARRPDGSLLRHKLLSSGRIQGAVGDGSNDTTIIDTQRMGDPDGIWNGYRLRLLDADGHFKSESTVDAFHFQDGRLRLAKPLSAAPAAGTTYEIYSNEEAPIVAIRYLLGCQLNQRIPPVTVRLGTTRGTNAMITRGGARTAFVTTRGFGDILKIGYQNRPHLFQLAIRKPTPLFSAAVEIDERITFDGQVLQRPDENAICKQLSTLLDEGIESLAICLLHGFAHSEHEQLVARCAREIGFDEISVSSDVAPLIKLVARGDTTVVDAYLNPVLGDYIRNLRQSLPESDLRILTSAGGLTSADQFCGKDSILSGPAGGVVGFTRAAEAAGFDRAIGFDMGGTSTDVSRFDGQFQLEYETEKAGVRIVAPMMAIETVAAGGGSICHFDGVKLAVGPDSAGADPGPACYGRGGPLSVTDVNLLLGKVFPQHFPFPLNRAAAQSRAAELIDQIAAATGRRYTMTELADGLLRIANANMAAAIRSISVAQGVDPRDYMLVAFGGAAAQHACAVARELGVRKVLNHPHAGILSAYGIGHADVIRHAANGVYKSYADERLAEVNALFDRLAADARQQVIDEGISADRIVVRRSLDLRYDRLDAFLTIAEPADGDFAAAYHSEHERRYGYTMSGRNLEIVAARIEVVGRSADPPKPSTTCPPSSPEAGEKVVVIFAGAPHDVPLYDRAILRPGDRIVGPAAVFEFASTTVIDPGWTTEVLSSGELLLTATEQRESNALTSTDADPVSLELFNNRFSAIARQMGITLQNTAISVNVKERLDFSCAIFTPEGDLVVNAPHIPVHLGAMSQTVRAIVADNPDLRPGDVFVTNDPLRGGSHLPDITVVTPVHDEVSGRLLFWSASRAHHAEIGGIRPGSMPPFSTNLAEEGVLIRNFKLFDGGRPRFDDLRSLLSQFDYPSRAVDDNLSDIAAQAAANRQGAADLQRLIESQSLPVVESYMHHIQDAAERKMRIALARLSDGRHEFSDYFDLPDGSATIHVAIIIEGDSAVIDFSGTDPVLSGNLNANRAIVTAAVMYVMRCLIDEDIPLNEGVLTPVEIIVPECLLNPPPHDDPARCAAVAGGNVETSQRVVDVLLGALGLAAASQGTMNNVLFGDESFGYYETICGGAGATADSPGADAVHTHMTNTRITDPEVLEQRFPVRVEEFSIRTGSGGNGRQRGGDGVVRRLHFLRNLDVSILSQRRGQHAPYGLEGGDDGAPGKNVLLQADDTTVTLPCQVELNARAGDRLVIETPGGGGFARQDSLENT